MISNLVNGKNTGVTVIEFFGPTIMNTSTSGSNDLIGIVFNPPVKIQILNTWEKSEIKTQNPVDIWIGY